MSDPSNTRRAQHVLQHFLPAETLRRANALAQQFERDRFFRSYVVRRIWLVVPIVLIAMYMVAAVIFEAGSSLVGLFAKPVYPVVRYGIISIGIVLWFIASLYVIYLLLAWLQKRARRAQEQLALAADGAQRSTSRIRRVAYLSIALAVVGGLGYWIYGARTAEARMKATCAAIKPGMSFDELKRFAARHGLLAPRSETGTAYLAEGRSFGRHACKVTVEQGIVKHSEYNYAD